MDSNISIKSIEKFIDDFIENKKPPISLLKKYRRKIGISEKQMKLSKQFSKEKVITAKKR